MAWLVRLVVQCKTSVYMQQCVILCLRGFYVKCFVISSKDNGVYTCLVHFNLNNKWDSFSIRE